MKALVRRLIGGELDRELAPILAVNLIGAIAGGMMFNFVGIWGAQRLGASNAELGFGFVALAVVGAVVGFVACTRSFGLHGVAEGPLEEAAATA